MPEPYIPARKVRRPLATIPQPDATIPSLHTAALATKEAVETLQGLRGDRDEQAVIWGELPPPPPPGPAPLDGGEYVMCNGIWRLKSQTFDLAGLTVQDVPVPAWGPTQGRFTFIVLGPSGSMQLICRMSGDGTNFPMGSADYYIGGYYHVSVNGGFGNFAWGGQAQWPLYSTTNVNSEPGIGEVVLQLVRTPPQPYFHGRLYSQSYDTGNQAIVYSGLLTATPFSAFNTIKAVRFASGPGTAIVSGRIVAEWLA